ncbi:sigma-70 family RNA polymerase sigma factor [Larkinella rosea]|uniref:RNA polymerase sigma factor n=2 Tax=Larkinella rosea TaxID=2025312 RepID=A0A3P1C3C8_9BACT|nr:sigma-70 family RNA polymerase sigma factor [Larkinella rosea]
MVSVLASMLGFDRIELAEDIVQDAMVQALRSWPFQGIPENPSAWLYRVAKNKALDVVRREKLFRQISGEFLLEGQEEERVERFFFEDEIKDSQLRMLFACCHPSLPFESQVAMCLKILCGLNVREIANAFLTSEETTSKRIYRAKEKIRAGDIRLEVPTGPRLPIRLNAVLKSIYLLFNEGYNSSHPNTLIRQDLCEEAMRLALLLTQNDQTGKPSVHALLALMCFQVARFDARTDTNGEIILVKDQDRTKWNRPLIAQGKQELVKSSEGNALTEYHLEALIAMQHCIAPSYEATSWADILWYYDLLFERKPTSIVALNRAVALAEVDGPSKALEAVLKITGLDGNQYYHAILGDLYTQIRNSDQARQHYTQAIRLTTSEAEKRLLQKKNEQLP